MVCLFFPRVESDGARLSQEDLQRRMATTALLAKDGQKQGSAQRRVKDSLESGEVNLRLPVSGARFSLLLTSQGCRVLKDENFSAMIQRCGALFQRLATKRRGGAEAVCSHVARSGKVTRPRCDARRSERSARETKQTD